MGYLAYDWIHFYEHHIQPKNKAGLFMRKFHAIHHFVDHNKNFGISTPLWDVVFRKLDLRFVNKSSEKSSTLS